LDTQDENRQPIGDAKLISSRIPDFMGYSDVNQRVEADSLLRAYIAHQLEGYKITLEEIIQAVAAEKRLDLLSDYDDLIQSIEEFKEQLEKPPEDCGEFFILEHLPEDELSEVYLLDSQLLEKGEHLKEQLLELKGNPLERNDARTLDSRLREMITCFNERSISMKGCRDGEEIS
jgi:hypothetical protein